MSESWPAPTDVQKDLSARPQRARSLGGTYRTSCGPFVLTNGSWRTEKPLQPFCPPSPFAKLHCKRFPRKYAVKIGMTVRRGGHERDGFVHSDRRAAAG